MNKKDWQRLLSRDGGRCLHCGETEAIAPNHRGNRGMGGSKKADVPSNLIVLCSAMNLLIESDIGAKGAALQFGWKISKWDTPFLKPVFDMNTHQWYLLDDNWMRVPVN